MEYYSEVSGGFWGGFGKVFGGFVVDLFGFVGVLFGPVRPLLAPIGVAWSTTRRFRCGRNSWCSVV